MDLNVFYALNIPLISLVDYIERLKKFIPQYSDNLFIMAFIYLNRIFTTYENFCNEYTEHRLLGTALVVSAKMLEDDVCSNKYFALVIGVSTTELLHMEITFLKLLDFKCFISKDEFTFHHKLYLANNNNNKKCSTLFKKIVNIFFDDTPHEEEEEQKNLHVILRRSRRIAL